MEEFLACVVCHGFSGKRLRYFLERYEQHRRATRGLAKMGAADAGMHADAAAAAFSGATGGQWNQFFVIPVFGIASVLLNTSKGSL